MHNLRGEERLLSFITSDSYLDEARLKEKIILKLFVKTDGHSGARMKRARKLDNFDVARTVPNPGIVWLVAPEFSCRPEVPANLARELASRGWEVHVVSRLLPAVWDGLTQEGVLIHYVRPLESYTSKLSGRGSIICFGLDVTAGLVLAGHRCISLVAEEDTVESNPGSVFIPDFIMGNTSIAGRNVFPLELDVLERLLCAKTRSLPVSPRVPTVSACLIARDEEGVIEECLESLVAFADETILNDTGSLDRTPEIAAAYGARVLNTVWQDDFAKARNDALAEARCSYVLTIDADERLVRETIVETKTKLAEGHEGYITTIRNEVSRQATDLPILRLFRNRLHHRYSGRIHEQIAYCIKGSIVSAPLVMRHVGYESAHSVAKGKRQRNIQLLSKAFASDESHQSNAYLQFQAAVELIHLGNFCEGLPAMLAVVENTDISVPFRPVAAMHVCSALIKQDRIDDVVPFALRILAEYPGFMDIAVSAAEALLNKGRPEDAEKVLKSVQTGKSPVGLPKSEGADTYRLHLVHARLALARGQADLAYQHVIQALDHKPDYAPAQSLLIDHWPERAVEVLGGMSSVRPAVLRCLVVGNKDLALKLAIASKDQGAAGEVHLAARNYEEAAECWRSSLDEWDRIRADVLTNCGLASRIQTDASSSRGLVERLLSGEPCGISELHTAVKVLGFLLDMGRDDVAETVAGSVRPIGEAAEFLVARTFYEKGRLKTAYRHIQSLGDTPDYLPWKARMAYSLGIYHESTACYAALESLMPLSPEDSVYYVDSLVKCNLIDMARQAAAQAYSRYSWNPQIVRLAQILRVANNAG